MNTRTRATGAVFIALGSVAAMLFLLASPAAAMHGGGGHHAPDPSSQESGESTAINGSVSSGTCVAVNDSTCSGSGVAVNDSVSSGEAVAINGSTASGCSLAVEVSTASGGECGPAADVDRDRDRHDRDGRRGAVKSAGVARPTAATGLAFTGPSTGPLMAAAAGALALGMLLVALGSDRRRAVHSS